MFRTRLLVGSLLALAAGGVLVADDWFPGTYPFLFACVLGVGVLATGELIRLLPESERPRRGVATAGVLLVLAVNWHHLLDACPVSPWALIAGAFIVSILAVFIVELGAYQGPGNATGRVANAVFVVAYLGLLASCFVRIRFDAVPGGLALAATVFVPKCGDIGAYLTGKLIGRHPCTPRLSPKKTWEGLAGGMVFAVATAVGVHYLGPVFRLGLGHAVAFGLVVGLLGILGDLAESMVKRDAQAKDASAAVPGFGGVLDVIDSVLFAAPAAYLLLRA